MSAILTIYDNPFDYSDCTVMQTDNPAVSLQKHFGTSFPDTARIFHEEICIDNDITPHDVAGVRHLEQVQGCVTCIVHPKFFLLGGLLGGNLFAIVLIGALAYLLRPTPPKEKNTANDSPNNGLTDRRNTGRPNARIPDIYGFVRSTPDLIAEPYFEFVDHREIEYVYLCVGRGEFEIEDVQDGETPIGDISGVSYEVYGPGTSPNFGGAEFTHGTPINERVWTAIKSNAVDGQILRPPNTQSVNGDEDIGFNDPDQIVTTNTDRNFEESFAEGDIITLTNTLSDGNTIDLDGTYTVLSVTSSAITLANPSTVNPNWVGFGSIGSSDTIITSASDKWVGPVTVENAYEVLLNFICTQGLYKLDAQGKQKLLTIDLEIEVTEVSQDDIPIGLPDTSQTVRIVGSDELQNQRSNSARFQLPGVDENNFRGRKWQIRVRRSSETPDLPDDERKVDECQWRDLYALGYVDKTDFGDVTTIQVRTAATSGALSVKERKFNCRAKRKVPIYQGSGVFGAAAATQYGGDIFTAIARDPLLGAMQDTEIDFEGIYAATAENMTYFGTNFTSEFNHTFDDKTLSAEDMLLSVAQAIHSIAYRQGGLLKLRLERKLDLASILFNHRNKIPDSETRTISFGFNEEYDGVDVDWTNPDSGVNETYRVPTDNSAQNPKKFEIPGIQSKEQAHTHGFREYNKILYRREALEFEATQEAMTLVRGDRIEVSDGTRPEVFGGEVAKQEGLLITLSHPFEYDPAKTYIMQLQLFDKQIQVFDIQVIDTTHVLLDRPPLRQLITQDAAPNKYTKTGYQIIANEDNRTSAFIVQELEPTDNFTAEIRAYNYDERYYANDDDINSGIFTSDQQVSVIFRENFEEVDLNAGDFVLVGSTANVDHYPGGGTFEIQNNVAGVGPAAQGSNHVELDGVNQGIVATLVTNPDHQHNLLFWYAGRPNVEAQYNRVDVYWRGIFFLTLQVDRTGESEIEWQPYFLQLPPTTTATTELRFQSTNDDGSGRGGLVDDIRVIEDPQNAVVPFTPTSLPNMYMWLDNVEANFDLDPAGGNIDEIDRWYDQSGNNHDAHQATNGFRPLYVRDAVNGNYVHFRGNSGLLGSNAEEFFFIDNVVTSASSAARTIFIVCEVDASADEEVSPILSSDDSTNPDSHIYLAPGGESTDPAHPFGISMDGNNVPDVGRWFVNGVEKGFGTHAGVPADIVTGQFQIHSIMMAVAQKPWEILGALEEGGGTPNAGFRGKMKEVLIYDGSMSGFNRVLVQNYLAAKHGIVI